MSPLISILMPVRNEETFLPQALESIFRQTFTNWELVAVDDHSDDMTPQILAQAAERDPRVRVLKPEARGLVPALNAGLAACRGELVARMDGDDVSHPRRLELQGAFMAQEPDVGLVACSFRHFPRSSLKVGMLAYEEWQNRLSGHEAIMADLFVESPFVHPSVCFRREAVVALGGYHDREWAEDYDLWLRMARAGVRFARLPQRLFFWRDRPERATRTMAAYTLEAFRACKAHHLCRSFLEGIDEVTLVGAGIEGRAWRRALANEGVRVAAWIDADPRREGRILHGAPVLPPGALATAKGKLLVTIGTRGARGEVRELLKSHGLRDGVDFCCVT